METSASGSSKLPVTEVQALHFGGNWKISAPIVSIRSRTAPTFSSMRAPRGRPPKWRQRETRRPRRRAADRSLSLVWLGADQPLQPRSVPGNITVKLA
jgi:hypothetical protein